jgi:hypothetical protein
MWRFKTWLIGSAFANVSMRSCGVPVESRQGFLKGTIALGVVALVSGLLRLAIRWHFEQGLQIDDYIMVATLVSSTDFMFDDFG